MTTNITDVYAFTSPERSDTARLIMDSRAFQWPVHGADRPLRHPRCRRGHGSAGVDRLVARTPPSGAPGPGYASMSGHPNAAIPKNGE